MCWAHARRKIVEKISVHVVQELQEEFEEDIDKLQVSSSQDVFNETKEIQVNGSTVSAIVRISWRPIPASMLSE